MTERSAGLAGVRAGEVLVVIPAFNEERSVGRVVARVRALGYPALVADDGSIDRTAEVAEQEGAVVLRLPVNLGVGGALRCGFRYAVTHGYRVVVQCDADEQHDPAQIANLLDALYTESADLVIGSRFAAGRQPYDMGRIRRVVMRRLARMASRRTGVRITDATSGFRAIGGNLLGAFASTYPTEYLGDTIESLARAGRGGYRVVEVPVEMRARDHGVSTASSLASAWYLIRVVAAVWLQHYRPTGRRVVHLTLWETDPASGTR
ncbi:MAG: glycosyltransferase family 2 protein [Actinomycetota bacterium]|nr:glycosyltransferase family 2 protein [Actinomycetota bacterium]